METKGRRHIWELSHENIKYADHIMGMLHILEARPPGNERGLLRLGLLQLFSTGDKGRVNSSTSAPFHPPPVINISLLMG